MGKSSEKTPWIGWAIVLIVSGTTLYFAWKILLTIIVVIMILMIVIPSAWSSK